jgi:hypothetical protein
MPDSADRFYLMEFRDRPVLWGDIGSALRIEGLVVGGPGTQIVLMLPGESPEKLRAEKLTDGIGILTLSAEEWSEFLRRSDDPQVLVGPAKAFHRKIRYAISGAVQQAVWAADDFHCVYCGTRMGKQLLAIDHFVPLELGGKNDSSNYLTACKPCNKDKGNDAPQVFCQRRGIEYESVLRYLEKRKREKGI